MRTPVLPSQGGRFHRVRAGKGLGGLSLAMRTIPHKNGLASGCCAGAESVAEALEPCALIAFAPVRFVTALSSLLPEASGGRYLPDSACFNPARPCILLLAGEFALLMRGRHRNLISGHAMASAAALLRQSSSCLSSHSAACVRSSPCPTP